jgi:hypothetical protein
MNKELVTELKKLNKSQLINLIEEVSIYIDRDFNADIISYIFTFLYHPHFQNKIKTK